MAGECVPRSIGDNSVTFEPLAGPEGTNMETAVRNAAFGFAEEFRVGHPPAGRG